MGNASYVTFDPPKRGLPDGGEVRCDHCGRELEAIGERFGSIGIKGIRWFDWRHVRTQKRRCTIEREGEPHDGWNATRKIEMAEIVRERT